MNQAVVCDMCSEQFGQRPACINACPHDAAMRVVAGQKFPVLASLRVRQAGPPPARAAAE